MTFSAHLFVGFVSDVAAVAGISPMVLSLLITPVATELPEKCNSVVWIGRKKDILAFGNISGAMVFQSSFPVAFGVAFTEWNLHGATVVSAVLALASGFFVLAWVKVKKSLNPYVLMTGGLLYCGLLYYVLSS